MEVFVSNTPGWARLSGGKFRWPGLAQWPSGFVSLCVALMLRNAHID